MKKLLKVLFLPVIISTAFMVMIGGILYGFSLSTCTFQQYINTELFYMVWLILYIILLAWTYVFLN